MYNLQGDPTSLEEALSPPDLGFWKEGINDEMDSIISNNSWKLVDLPPASIRLDTHLCVHVCAFYSFFFFGWHAFQEQIRLLRLLFMNSSRNI